MTSVPRRKLIEVALPLDAINRAAARERAIRHGHPNTLHLWWARRPLAVARAVTAFGDLFTSRQLVSLSTLSDLIGEVRERVRHDVTIAGRTDEEPASDTASSAYADAVARYLGIALSRITAISNSLCRWDATSTPTRRAVECLELSI